MVILHIITYETLLSNSVWRVRGSPTISSSGLQTLESGLNQLTMKRTSQAWRTWLSRLGFNKKAAFHLGLSHLFILWETSYKVPSGEGCVAEKPRGPLASSQRGIESCRPPHEPVWKQTKLSQEHRWHCSSRWPQVQLSERPRGARCSRS